MGAGSMFGLPDILRSLMVLRFGHGRILGKIPTYLRIRVILELRRHHQGSGAISAIGTDLSRKHEMSTRPQVHHRDRPGIEEKYGQGVTSRSCVRLHHSYAGCCTIDNPHTLSITLHISDTKHGIDRASEEARLKTIIIAA